MSRIEDRLVESVVGGVAVHAALQVGLLFELLKGPAVEAELVERLKLDRRAARLLIDLLETLDFAVRDGDKVRAGNVLLAVNDRPGGYALTLGLWGHVEKFVRTGEPFIAMDQSAGEREAIYQKVVGGLGTLMEPIARQLAEKLPGSPNTILDIGCGSGVWGLAVAQRHPAARLTGLDLPAVLENFVARAASFSLSDRIERLPGDMHAIDIPAGAFDLVIIANVLRLDVPERAGSLVERAARAVAPGGSLVIVDALAHGSKQADLDRATYALHLGMRTRSGEVHSPATITRWLARAGLSDVQSIPLTDAMNIGVLQARKS